MSQSKLGQSRVGLRGAWVPQVSPHLYEMKFLADSDRWPEVEAALDGLAVADDEVFGGNGTYNHSIYFDSPAYRAHNRAQTEELVRVRPRLRVYRRHPDSTASDIYLELKRHYGRVVAKRRARIERDLAESLLAETAGGLEGVTGMSSVLAEFAFLAERFDLRPSLSVLYHRSAYRSPDSALDKGSVVPNLRVTVDRIVQHGPVGQLDQDPDAFAPVLPPDRLVVEVKYGEAVPDALLGRLRRLGLSPRGFSKYDCALAAQSDLIAGALCAPEPA